MHFPLHTLMPNGTRKPWMQLRGQSNPVLISAFRMRILPPHSCDLDDWKKQESLRGGSSRSILQCRSEDGPPSLDLCRPFSNLLPTRCIQRGYRKDEPDLSLVRL